MARATFDWLDEQVEHVAELASSSAHVPVSDGGGIVWMGWGGINNKRWAERYEDLRFEDREPPWRADVRLYLLGLRENSKEGRELQNTTLKKIQGLRCQEHDLPVHVTLRGVRYNFSVEVTACCQPMVKMARKYLGIEK